MLRYPYFCRMYKECLSCWLESSIPQQKRIHTIAEKYQTQAQELHRSQDRDFETTAKLHIPVMVDEVVHWLSPEKDRFSRYIWLGRAHKSHSTGVRYCSVGLGQRPDSFCIR
uniref:Uncharacterized protein n=1 Tax=Rhinopithecus bieti TaxID=61621 RepID=A0A2K6KIS8_RHIBE